MEEIKKDKALTITSNAKNNYSGFKPQTEVPIGGVVLSNEDIEYNLNRSTITIKVRNTGDRPIQVGSHFHFFEVNRYMEFDRKLALGMHLNIPATTAVRFEPGEEKTVELVAFGGKCRILGFNNLTEGCIGDENSPAYYPIRLRSLRRITKYGFKNACIIENDTLHPTSTK
jgi:urease subunit beta